MKYVRKESIGKSAFSVKNISKTSKSFSKGGSNFDQRSAFRDFGVTLYSGQNKIQHNRVKTRTEDLGFLSPKKIKNEKLNQSTSVSSLKKNDQYTLPVVRRLIPTKDMNNQLEPKAVVEQTGAKFTRSRTLFTKW